MQEAILTLLAKESAHGYELHRRIAAALGSSGGSLNPGRVYIALARLEKAGLVVSHGVEQASRPAKKVYGATPEGRDRAREWLHDVTWSKPGPMDFHLKLVAAAATRMADPVTLIDAQRRELLRQLTMLQRAAEAEASDTDGALLLEGASLHLQADLTWLEACERRWTRGGER